MRSINLGTVLGSLRVGLHTMFALLLAFGVVRAAGDGDLDARVCGLAIALGIIYVWGTVKRPPTRRAAYWWLALITILWIGLMVHARDFMWLEFPLLFLFLHGLPRAPGLVSTVCLWAGAALIPAWRYPDQWTVAAAVGPAIGTVFAIAFYYAYVALRDEALRYRALAEELRATQEELARSENLAGRLAERARLSREIHDTVAQGLGSIVLMARAGKNAADPSGHLKTIATVAQDSLQETRKLVQDLAAPPQLTTALEALVEAQNERARTLGEDTHFELVETGDTTRKLPDKMSSCLERAAREGLSNVAKHAHAQRAVVTLGVFEDEATLDVVDDGRGFATTNNKGFGLPGLRARVAELGGRLEMSPGPGTGTALTVRLPLKEKQ